MAWFWFLGAVSGLDVQSQDFGIEGGNEGTQPEFPFTNSGNPSGTPTDSKKKQIFHFV